MGARGRTGKLVREADALAARHPRKSDAAPRHLGAEGAAFFVAMRAKHSLDGPAEIETLTRACECIDTIAAARASMAKTGPIIKNQYDIEKLHPGLVVEKQARDGYYAALRLLDLRSHRDRGGDVPPWVD